MYTIIGADGKEYGPVAADKLRGWIAAGRANAQTQCRREGDTAWSTLGSVPEFAAAFAAAPAPGAVPVAGAATPEAVLAAATPLDISGCLRDGWETAKANFLPILGVSLLIGICAGVIGIIPIVGMLASLFLTGVFYGGLYFYILKRKRGEPTEVGDAFSGFTVAFGQLALATFVVTVLTVIAFFCLILPGIYLAVCWAFTYLLIREKGLQFWDAMELGRKVVTAQWFRVFGLGLAVLGLALALSLVPVGLISLGATQLKDGGGAGGVFVAIGGLMMVVITIGMIPFVSSVLVHAYDRLFNPGARSA
jgi:uncharacterized membrane protein